MPTENSFDSGYDSSLSDTASGMEENSNVESLSTLTPSASTSTPAESKGPPPPPPPPPPEENITVAMLEKVVEDFEKSLFPEEEKQLIVKGLRSIINNLKQAGLGENDRVPKDIVDALKKLNILFTSGVLSVSASKQSPSLQKNLVLNQSFLKNIEAKKNKLKKTDQLEKNNNNVKNSKENKKDVKNKEFIGELAKTLSRRSNKQDVAQDQSSEYFKKNSSTVTYLLSKQDIEILQNIIKLLCLKDNLCFYSSFKGEYDELLKIDTLGYDESHKFLTKISKDATSFLVSEMSKKEKIQRKDYMDLCQVMEPIIKTEKDRDFFDVKAILHERKEKAESANKNCYFLMSLKDKKFQESTKVIEEGRMSQMNPLSSMESAQREVAKPEEEGSASQNEASAAKPEIKSINNRLQFFENKIHNSGDQRENHILSQGQRNGCG